MPSIPYVELFSFGQEFALVIPRPTLNQTGGTLYNGATENDLVGFASVVSHELGRIRDFWEQPSSRTWTLMLLTGGGIAVYLLCRRKCEEENESIIFSGLDPSHRRRPSSHGRRGSRWGARTWFGWLYDPSTCDADDVTPNVFEGQYFGPPLVGPSNDMRRLVGSARKIDAKLVFAPCPNCLKGSCKIKKHRNISQKYLTIAESNTSSSSTSPMRGPNQALAFAHSSSTPELADDEDSEGEPDGVLQRVADLHKFNDRFFRPGLDNRLQGDGEQHNTSKRNLSSGSRKSSSAGNGSKGRNRVPPEGREKLLSPSKRSTPNSSSLRKNLSCGDATCKDMFCLAQQQQHLTPADNNNSLSFSNIDRETSIDSISVANGHATTKSVSKGMIGLIRGAREVRRLIREASFDSTASEFSLGVSIAEDLCDADKTGRSARIKVSSRCASDLESMIDFREMTCSESEESQVDFRFIQQKCASSQKQKRLWRLSAPINASDFDSPEHHPSNVVADETSGVWSSPNHVWHDQKLPKYKLALHSGGGGSKTHSSSVSEVSEGLDGLEWDTEDFAPSFDDAISELGFCVDKWLEDNLELDLEAELSRFNSERSSRRNSLSSDLDSNCLYRSVRLPPSGRSSVTHGMNGGDSSSCETPQKNIDHEMLIRSFGVASASPPKDSCCRPASISLSKRHVGNCGLKSPSYSKWKESSPIYDNSSSRRHYQRDILSHDMTTVTMSNNGCLLATTPLSPVHEAKEPRQRHELQSPTTDDSVICDFDTISSPIKRQILFRDNSSCALPDLEECNT